MLAGGSCSCTPSPSSTVILRQVLQSLQTTTHNIIISRLLQLACKFDAALGCASPDISAPCLPMTSTARQDLQALAAFADDLPCYEGSALASNAQVCSRHYPRRSYHTSNCLQLASIAVAIKRCSARALAMPLLLLFACAPAGVQQ